MCAENLEGLRLRRMFYKGRRRRNRRSHTLAKARVRLLGSELDPIEVDQHEIEGIPLMVAAPTAEEIKSAIHYRRRRELEEAAQRGYRDWSVAPDAALAVI